MNFQIPIPLQQEHEALHERLRAATQAGGDEGEAAKSVAQLMHLHFVKEIGSLCRPWACWSRWRAQR